MLLALLIGFCVGALLMMLVLCWDSDGAGVDELAAFRARQELADIERQTISRLTEAAFAARAQAPVPGNDIIEGTATDLDRPS